jgi:hypothetical protein
MPSPLRRLVGSVTALKQRHRERHSPSGLGFAIAEHPAQLNPAHWAAVTAQASVFLQLPYLTALADAPPEGVGIRVALIYRAGQPVAAVLCQCVAITGGRIGATKAPLTKLRQRALVCGNLLSWGQHAVAFAPGVDQEGLWLGVGEALYRIRRAERLAGQTNLVLVKDLPEARVPPDLATLGYKAFATDPDMVLEHGPKVTDFAGYLASMNAKYRKAAKDAIADVTKAGATVEVLTDVAAEAGRLQELYLQVQARASVRLATMDPGYLPALQRTLGEGFRVVGVRRGGTLIGFLSLIRDGDTAVAYLIGFEESANAEMPLYFRLLYAGVEHGLLLGCRRLSLGRTALEAKAKLGAKPVALHVALRHRVSAANALIHPLLRWVPHGEAPERSVFKEV